MTTASTVDVRPAAVHSVDTGRPAAIDTRTSRRRWAGVALIAAPLALFASEVAYRGSNDSSQLVTDASHHATSIAISNVLLLISAALFVPAAIAIAHLARDRGRRLAVVGTVLTVLGSLGHAAYVGFSTVVLSTPHGDRAQMVALLDRVNHSAAAAPIAICIVAFGFSVVVLALASWRAGLAAVHAPIAVGIAFLIELAHAGSPAAGDVKEALLVLAFGTVGLRLLRMSDGGWTRR